MSLKTTRSTAVLGAGLAGLAAATRLADAGHDVTVYEARDRVGGRVWSTPFQTGPETSSVIERGAEFVLHGYDQLRELIGREGLDLVETGMSYYARALVETPEISIDDIAAAGQLAAKLGREVIETEPTTEDILQRLDVDKRIVDALRTRIEISTAVESDKATAVALEQIASFRKLPSWRIGGGNQGLPLALAAALGDRIRLNEPVRRVNQLVEGVSISTNAGSAVYDSVIVALPLAVVIDSDTIQIDIPTWKRAALDNVLIGHAAKLHLPLKTRPEATSTMSVPGRFWNWTAVDATGEVAPVLNGFMGSMRALKRAGLDEGPDRFIQAVRTSRPDLDFHHDYPALLTHWAADPWARHAYSSHAPAMRPEHGEVMERAVGDVYFAGEYADMDHTGLMEGAVRSGQRAAGAILARVPSLATAS